MSKAEKGAGKKPAALGQPAVIILTEEQQQKLRQRIDTEVDVNRLAAKKLATSVREKMRLEKAEILRDQVQRDKSGHQASVEHSDALISALKEEIEDEGVQYRDAVNGYLLSLDELQQFQKERFDNVHSQFMGELDIVNDEFTQEREQIMIKYRQEQQDLGGLLKKVSDDIQELIAAENQEWQGHIEDDKNKINEDKQTLKIQMEAQIEDLWKQFQLALNEFNDMTRDRRSQYDILKKKDAENASVIGDQTKRLIKLQDQIATLKQQYTSNLADFQDQSHMLKRKKEMLSHHFQMMKRNMGSKRGDERKRLTELTVQGKHILKQIESYAKRATEIIRAAEQCQRHETDQDRFTTAMLYQYNDSELVELKQELDRIDQQITADLKVDKVIMTERERQAFLAFSGRYSKVKMDVNRLEQERLIQQEKNRQLKQQLKHILEGMAVSETVLDKDNCLFMVNGKSNIVKDVPVKDRPFNITEGALYVRTHGKQQ